MKNERLNDKDIRDAISGGLRYLADTFVFDQRHYKVHPNNFTVDGRYEEKYSIKYSASLRKKQGNMS